MKQCSNLIRVSNILRFHHPKILQFLQVLIAPLFVPIFVLSRGGDDGNTRKKKKERKGKKRQGRKRRKKKNLFHNQLQPVHPRHFTREHFFATVSVTRCTFLLARVLAYFLSLFFFEFLLLYYTTLIVLRAWLQTSRALSLAKNAISAMTLHQKTNIA